MPEIFPAPSSAERRVPLFEKFTTKVVGPPTAGASSPNPIVAFVGVSFSGSTLTVAFQLFTVQGTLVNSTIKLCVSPKES